MALVVAIAVCVLFRWFELNGRSAAQKDSDRLALKDRDAGDVRRQNRRTWQ